MTTLSDLIGADTQPWMSTPGRNCDTDRLFPREVQFKADQWFPTDHRETPERAATLCAGCPVSAKCLEFALARPELEGIYGGTTTGQRNKARRAAREGRERRELRPCGTSAGYMRHRRAGQDACADCKAANAEASRVKSTKRRAA